MIELLGITANRAWCAEAAEAGNSFTLTENGKIIGCAGILTTAEGVGTAWALYVSDIGTYHIDPQIAKDKIYEIIDANKYRRVECTVRCDFPAGMSYTKWLGFELDGKKRCNEPDGTDAYTYGMVTKYGLGLQKKLAG